MNWKDKFTHNQLNKLMKIAYTTIPFNAERPYIIINENNKKKLVWKDPSDAVGETAVKIYDTIYIAEKNAGPIDPKLLETLSEDAKFLLEMPMVQNELSHGGLEFKIMIMNSNDSSFPDLTEKLNKTQSIAEVLDDPFLDPVDYIEIGKFSEGFVAKKSRLFLTRLESYLLARIASSEARDARDMQETNSNR